MSSAKYWVVIPAAGTGSRMQSEIPKQYLKLGDRTVLEHTVEKFTRHKKISRIVVVISPDDPYWQTTTLAGNDQVSTASGGKERCDSVLNGLKALADYASEQDWVLVHDAARPCVSGKEIDSLITGAGDHKVGGILAVPVRDTMKRGNTHDEITETVNRDGLWHALTPQMFRYGKLVEAMTRASAAGKKVTDEAQAMELTGVNPLLVKGEISNIKITQMGDLELARFYLQQQD